MGGAEAGGIANRFEWTSATPESQGLNSAKLEAFRDEMAERSTSALLVVRNDRIVFEWYAQGTSPATKLATASTAKAVFGGLAAAVEIGDGLVALDDPASKFVPQWRSDPLKAKITIRELGSHTSGLDDAEADQPVPAGSSPGATATRVPHEKLTGWKGDFWKRLPVPADPFSISRDLVPVVAEPGRQFSYSNPGIAMLAYSLTAALGAGSSGDLRTLVRDRVMRRIGIGDDQWEAGYKQTFTVDGLPLVPVWGGGAYTARGFARIGRLMLRGGNWEGQQILKPEAVAAVTTGANAAGPGEVAIGWWNNDRGRIHGMPRNVYFAAGAGHRLVVVIPDLEVIIVRNGDLLSTTEPYMAAQDKYFFQPMIRALGMDQPAGAP
jgi:CubicO group peptidase (beta-lactamase class C family)